MEGRRGEERAAVTCSMGCRRVSNMAWPRAGLASLPRILKLAAEMSAGKRDGRANKLAGWRWLKICACQRNGSKFEIGFGLKFGLRFLRKPWKLAARNELPNSSRLFALSPARH